MCAGCLANILKAANQVARENKPATMWYVLYAVLTACWIIAAVGGLVGLYNNYAGCDYAQAFIIITTVMGTLQTMTAMIVTSPSPLYMFTPTLFFAFNVFLCW